MKSKEKVATLVTGQNKCILGLAVGKCELRKSPEGCSKIRNQGWGGPASIVGRKRSQEGISPSRKVLFKG